MTHHVFYRDFSVCRAYLLAGLIGLALMLGKQPGPELTQAEAEPLLQKATYVVLKSLDCPADKAADTGVDL